MHKQILPQKKRPTSTRPTAAVMPRDRMECSMCSDEVPEIAGKLGASASECAWLSAIFDLEGFGGLEYNRRYSALRVVASQLRRLRSLAGVPDAPSRHALRLAA